MRLSSRRDRSSLMTAIGHRVTLIKGRGRSNQTVPFFSVSDVRRNGGQPAVQVTAKKPVRNDSRTHVTRRICASDLHMVRSLTGATFIPLSPLPPPAAFFSLPFSLVSYRCLLALFKYGGHTGGCDRSSRLVTGGLREKGGAHEDLAEGPCQAALILTVLTNRLNDNDRRRPSRGTARRCSTLLTPRSFTLSLSADLPSRSLPLGMLDQAGSRPLGAT